MGTLARSIRRLWYLLNRRRFERVLQEEMAAHREAMGDPVRFGSSLRLQDQAADVWGWRPFDDCVRDLRHGARRLRRSPGFTCACVLTFAVGLGAVAAVFSLLSVVLLRPLPFPDADRLVLVVGTVMREQVERRGNSFPDFYDWRAQTRSFDGMAAVVPQGLVMRGGTSPELVAAALIDGPYLELLGANPLAGRLFAVADYAAGAAGAAIIGERLWERQFDRDPAVIGRALQADDRPYTVVGVLPASLRTPVESELWLTVGATTPPAALQGRGQRGFTGLARLAPGMSIEAAQADVHAVSRRLELAYPETNAGRSAEVVPLAQEVFGNLQPPAVLLFAMAGLVLLIACVNVASLLLVRGDARRLEISISRALGARGWHLGRQRLAEAMLLVFAGGSAGWLLALWAEPALLALSPIRLPHFVEAGLDWRTLLFTTAIGAAAACLVSLAAPRAPGRGSIAADLQCAGAGARSSGPLGVMRTLIVAQMAVAMVLLVGALLFARSFTALLSFEPGFEAEGRLSLRVSLPPAGAAPDDRRSQHGIGALAVLDALRAIPRVTGAALATSAPLGGASAIFYTAEGSADRDARTEPRAYVHRVTPGYFDTLGLALLEGRDFEPSDLLAGNTAVIVSAGVAHRFWPDTSAIGHRLKPGRPDSDAPWLTIVGVVEDANLRGIPRNPTADPDLYFPFNDASRGFAALVATEHEPSGLIDSTRAAIRRLEPQAVVFGERPLEDLVAQQLAPARFLSWLMGVFAALAVVLVAVGIYGTMAYWVRQRLPEIAIRAALGADRHRLLALVARQVTVVAVCGCALGALIAAVAGLAIDLPLYGVSPLDLVSFGVAIVVLAAAAAVASLLPARRATRVSPTAMLRRA